jgi:hypothetical protein
VRRAIFSFRRGSREFLHFICAWLLLGIARASILSVSFRRLAPALGTAVGPAVWIPLLDRQQERRAWQVARAVHAAAARTPWTSNCFPQAIAARVLLGFYGTPCVVCFGLARDRNAGGLSAHAWVAAGRVPVSGGEGFSAYSVVGAFVSAVPKPDPIAA